MKTFRIFLVAFGRENADLRTFTVNEKQIFIFYQLVGHNNPKPFLSPWRPKTCNLIKNPEWFFFSIRMYTSFSTFFFALRKTTALFKTSTRRCQKTHRRLWTSLSGGFIKLYSSTKKNCFTDVRTWQRRRLKRKNAIKNNGERFKIERNDRTPLHFHSHNEASGKQ